jgi:hypothetical protein
MVVVSVTVLSCQVGAELSVAEQPMMLLGATTRQTLTLTP